MTIFLAREAPSLKVKNLPNDPQVLSVLAKEKKLSEKEEADKQLQRKKVLEFNEKLKMDIEMLQQNIYLNRTFDVSDDAFAFDAIREVGPGSHYFGADHTQRRFKTAFYAPFLSDWRNYETWEETGALKTEERANRMVKAILEDYQKPAMDEGHHEALVAFIEKRRKEGGAPTDF